MPDPGTLSELVEQELPKWRAIVRVLEGATRDSDDLLEEFLKELISLSTELCASLRVRADVTEEFLLFMRGRLSARVESKIGDGAWGSQIESYDDFEMRALLFLLNNTTTNKFYK
ncbi:hypothetical protein HY29_18210 [Hyphomonas beringensis]|uniref:Uncharacterized protein n=1 Tax=Hyphomonas beringensis TaxID=1280946 RepID=A0A062U3E2_9PROT|nr:hypothetical protein HY29_18210 [Hyphomonas beringensis]